MTTSHFSIQNGVIFCKCIVEYLVRMHHVTHSYLKLWQCQQKLGKIYLLLTATQNIWPAILDYYKYIMHIFLLVPYRMEGNFGGGKMSAKLPLAK